MSGAIGKRIKMRYRGDRMYISVFPDNMEIFISKIENPDVNGNDMTMAGIDIITRMASAVWKSNGLDFLLNQLKKSSRVKSDLPGILHSVLCREGVV